MNATSPKTLTMPSLFRSDSGCFCNRHQAVEQSFDDGATWQEITPPTPAEQRRNRIRGIAQFLKARMPCGAKIELRVLGVQTPNKDGKTHSESGIFTDAVLLAEAAERYRGRAKGIYYCINSVDLVPEGFTLNEMTWGRGVEDNQISRRTTLFIEIDAIRPDKKQAATEEEKRAARITASKIGSFLHELGWPEPQIQDSGNGYYLLHKINLPAEDGGITRRILNVLKQKFGEAVDAKVFNPSRLARLPYTRNTKGDNTPERPNRLAHVLESPAKFEEVPESLLNALADTWVETEPMHAAPASSKAKYTCSSRASAAQPYYGDVPVDKRVRRASAYAAKMPPAIDGQGGHNATWAVMQMILIGFAVPEPEAWPIIHEYNARCQPPWSDSELAHKVKDVLTKSRLPMGLKLEVEERLYRTNIGETPEEIAAALFPIERERRERALFDFVTAEAKEEQARRETCWRPGSRTLDHVTIKRAFKGMLTPCHDCPGCFERMKREESEKLREYIGTWRHCFTRIVAQNEKQAARKAITRMKDGKSTCVPLPGGAVLIIANVQAPNFTPISHAEANAANDKAIDAHVGSGDPRYISTSIRFWYRDACGKRCAKSEAVEKSCDKGETWETVPPKQWKLRSGGKLRPDWRRHLAETKRRYPECFVKEDEPYGGLFGGCTALLPKDWNDEQIEQWKLSMEEQMSSVVHSKDEVQTYVHNGGHSIDDPAATGLGEFDANFVPKRPPRRRRAG